MPQSHERALKALQRRGRLRTLSPRVGIDFSSNDYLGLGASPELRQSVASALARGVAVGSGGSRLLRGNDPEHERLESDAARLFGAESALFLSSGYTANYALFSTLPQRGDLVVFDGLIHASVHDGLRAGKAEVASAAHNDPQAFEDAIVAWRARGGAGQPWIAVESLYSMDGDRSPLDDLMSIADRHDGMLVIDEAHATGVHGDRGRGLGSHLEGRANVISLHTCGKALGVMGALIIAPTELKDYLINRSRPFIYSTAPSPLIAATVRAALELAMTASERRERLKSLVERAGLKLSGACRLEPTGTQIQPIIVGSDARATRLQAALQRQGFDIRAVRPPTVPEGTARLRISLTLNATPDDVDRMIVALASELERSPS